MNFAKVALPKTVCLLPDLHVATDMLFNTFRLAMTISLSHSVRTTSGGHMVDNQFLPWFFLIIFMSRCVMRISGGWYWPGNIIDRISWSTMRKPRFPPHRWILSGVHWRLIQLSQFEQILKTFLFSLNFIRYKWRNGVGFTLSLREFEELVSWASTLHRLCL